MSNFQMGKQTFVLCFALALFGFSSQSRADYYSCYKKIYEAGWLKKYEYKGNSWSANTKKSGPLSSTAGVSTENTTSSVDPGVSTGDLMSSAQYTSSWGECAAVDMLISKNMRDGYIEQNLLEIKQQVAQGQGYHLASLAVLSGCTGATNQATFSRQLQSHMGDLYDTKNGAAFREKLDVIILENADLKTACRPPA